MFGLLSSLWSTPIRDEVWTLSWSGCSCPESMSTRGAVSRLVLWVSLVCGAVRFVQLMVSGCWCDADGGLRSLRL